MYGNRLTTSLILTLGLLSGASWANPPWPFPWAKDCPVDWTKMEGQYAMSEEALPVHAEDVRISFSVHNGLYLMQVSRYNLQGELTYDGYTPVRPGQNSVQLYLNSIGGQEAPVIATIKLYFESGQAECSMSKLVPIMTLESVPKAPFHHVSEYKLVRK